MNKKRIALWILIPLALCLVLGLFAAYGAWRVALKPNFSQNNTTDGIVFIEKNDSFDDFLSKLKQDSLLIDEWSLQFLARQMGFYSERTLPAGCYKINPSLGNLQQLRNIAARMQQPVKLIVNSVRLPEQLASKIAPQLMLDSTELINYFNDSSKMAQLGYTPKQLFTLFVSNTYEVWWTISVDDLMQRMKRESNAFWNDSRRTKAKNLGLTIHDVVILASIVEEESNYLPEQPRIAGLYLNRLNRNIPLQSDPTVKFALKNFTLNQILFSHLEVESPYNTYKVVGLPPSPIRLPKISTIDAVLNAEQHNYIYMCANESLNGTHRFAVTLSQHNRNAAKYHVALRSWLKNQKK